MLFPAHVPVMRKKSSAQAKTKKETKENKGSYWIATICVVGDRTTLVKTKKTTDMMRAQDAISQGAVARMIASLCGFKIGR